MKYEVSRLIRSSFTPEGRKNFSRSFKVEYSPEFDYFLPINKSVEKRIKAHWISTRREIEFRLGKYYGMKVIFPFLDEELISKILKKEPLE